MTREQIIESISNINYALDKSGLGKILLSIDHLEHESDSLEIITAFNSYSLIASEKFKTAETLLIDSLGGIRFDSPKILNYLLNTEQVPEEIKYELYKSVKLIQDYLPKIREILIRDFEKDIRIKNKQEQHIKVILPEDKQTSRPERLSDILDSIQSIYDVFATIYDSNKNELTVVGIDSGSDKSFDFMGSAKAMESVRKLLTDLWDRIVFYRERKISEKLELVAKSLPIISDISNLIENNQISPEQGEILKRQIISGSNKFIESGAMLPEFDNGGDFNPRLLMTPEPKLLSQKTEEQSTANENRGKSKSKKKKKKGKSKKKQ